MILDKNKKQWHNFCSMQNGFYLIEQLLPECSPVEQRVACFLLKNREAIIKLNVHSIATRAKVSSSAVIRLCKRLNFSGFKEFKIALASAVYETNKSAEKINFDFNAQSSTSEICQKLFNMQKTNLDNFAQLLSEKNLDKAVNILDLARVIHCVGLGASGIAAQDFTQKFTRLGRAVFYTSDSHLQITAASTMQRDDILVAFSYSGETQEIINCALEAKKNKAKIISITGLDKNSLARLSDVTLFVPHSEPLLRYGASLSRLNTLFLIDIVYNILIARNYQNAIPSLKKTSRSSGMSV